MSKRYWEDFRVGDRLEYGRYRVNRDEIVEFAREFDPQVFHVDEEAAKASPFGGLIASGWQSAGFLMRMLVEHFLADTHSMGSPGVEWLRWRKPVRPGDTLRVRQEVLETKPSRNHANMGHVRNRFQLVNQDDDIVLEMQSFGTFLRRPTEGAGEGGA